MTPSAANVTPIRSPHGASYIMFNNRRESFDVAQLICEANEGDLPKLRHARDYEWLKAHVKTPTWLGAKTNADSILTFKWIADNATVDLNLFPFVFKPEAMACGSGLVLKASGHVFNECQRERFNFVCELRERMRFAESNRIYNAYSDQHSQLADVLNMVTQLQRNVLDKIDREHEKIHHKLNEILAAVKRSS